MAIATHSHDNSRNGCARCESTGRVAVHRSVVRADPGSYDRHGRRMHTSGAAAAADVRAGDAELVHSRTEIVRRGISDNAIRAHLAAGRWQLCGTAVVLHNAQLTRQQRWTAALINVGPRSVLTSFTGLEQAGLEGWQRDEIHVLAPAGAVRVECGLPIVLHRTRLPPDRLQPARCHRPAPAALLAAASFASPRPGVGILAATVQQRLATAAELRVALACAPKIRHRVALIAAVADIGMGADALSEIDFVRLCRRAGLPRPRQQAVRVEPSGRRRYLDAEWVRADGRRVAVEVDGAIHLAPARWFADQLRQNEITLSGTVVLRFPSAILRTEPGLVIAQLRRALL